MSNAIQKSTGVESLVNLYTEPALSEQLASTIKRVRSLVSPSASPWNPPWISFKQLRRTSSAPTTASSFERSVGTQLPASEIWQRPCEAVFEHLAERHPLELVQWITSGELKSSDLTFAAEIAGRHVDADRIIPVLLDLLSHASSIVREGSLYGLAGHLTTEVRRRVAELASNDPSPTIRAIANEILSDE